ncbi:FtsW/RodA/SpoVE family cell cycle protein [Mucisphaera calidilacus]|uniref:Cell wall polymerase n=1 Tax=Mucisphaera calidilacus TaxID=2527982 RepID=A0A518BXI4_9BACT|nr:FtsW/RodA/SpoVE family cell cycle protein [Mucisphaera calidilacus]QDU71668.1 Peptidoglycan glycosyltransferase MrdB [Mucisphaera calidilacus]
MPEPTINLSDQLLRLATTRAVWSMIVSALLLAVAGLLSIGVVEPGLAAKQGKIWLPISLFAAGLVFFPRPRTVGTYAYPLMALTLCLLILLVMPFTPRWLVPVINGARAWINLGVMNFQPAELAKVAFVLGMAWYLRHRKSHRTLLGMLKPFLLMLVPVGLILKQPDLGTAILFAPTLFIMLVAAGARMKHIVGLLGVAILVIVANIAIVLYAPSSMQILKPHQRERIESMISLAQGETRYVTTIGYQQDTAMTLVAAGGLTGYDPQRVRDMIELNKLPFDHNDMIFAVVAARWGWLGGAALIGLYLTLTASMALIAADLKDPFARLATVGFAGMMFTQAAINIGMTVGLLPITGITLPFVSYGGSSLLFSAVMIGLVCNFVSRRPAPLSRPSFEFDQNAEAIFQ